MSAVMQVAERSERPAYVRFKRVAVEDKARSATEGRWIGRDVDYAMITPPYSKDVVEMKVQTWLERMDADVKAERIPLAWAQMYRQQYEAWRNGQELPPNGTPIKGWPVISPAQQEMLIRINILTVEDLAAINDEGARRIGMGAVELKHKAAAWLRTAEDKGPLTQENAALKMENQSLRQQIETLLEQVERLKSRAATTETSFSNPASLTADDILPEVEASNRTARKK